MGQSREGIEKIIATTQSALGEDQEPVDTTKPYTLEEYAIDHFRPPKARTLSGSLRGGIRRNLRLWTNMVFLKSKSIMYIRTQFTCYTSRTH